ncbi:MAG: class II aldolase/adducin family protein [Candidatus Omnitrophica bacterium]|nr:class II aldolase/adducin family protein [Candidatus Omnitrophota bacterium]
MAGINKLKNEIIDIGKLLWDKDLASALNGNMSVRVDEKRIILSATKTCLGRLSEKDLLLCDNDGNSLEAGKVTSEKLMHTSIYKNFPDVRAVIHTHTPYVNGYFMEHPVFVPRIFEAKLYLGEIKAIDQSLPTVQDINPVLAELKSKGLAVLRHHGVLATGPELFDCFCWIQNLEEAIKTECIATSFNDIKSQGHNVTRSQREEDIRKKAMGGIGAQEQGKIRHKMFSREHIQAIVDIVNGDEKMKQLGEQTNMTMELAVKLDETGQVYSFNFEKGKITKVGNNENAEFLTSAPEVVWRAVFKREIDPFVATTQKKMILRGDFARISKWYAPCSRVFELWTKAVIEG